MTNVKELMQVAEENWRDNNFGNGVGHGDVDPAVAADLGYSLPEDMPGIIERFKSMNPQKQKVATKAGEVICADCGQVIPCQHAGINSAGAGFTKGY